MNKIYLLAASLVLTTAAYGAGNNDQSSGSSSSSSNASKMNTSGQSSNQGAKLLSANDEKGYGMSSVSDQKLTKSIRDKLSSGFFSKGYEGVTVDVRNGNVILSGSVKTEADKAKVEKEIRAMDGVSSLASQIAVQERSGNTSIDNKYPQDRFATPADQQLNLKIRDKITGWFGDSHPNLSISTRSGNVTLEGFVASPKDEQTLITEIRKIDGVRSVDSNLQVKSTIGQ